MIHYHGTPITPRTELLKLAGRNFCVSFANSGDVKTCFDIGQSVMLDNGAFSVWRKTKVPVSDWKPYYDWCDKWLQFRNAWAVIPDVIDGGEEDNDRLLSEWPHGSQQGAPVWHLNEPLKRLTRLAKNYPRVCFGSTGIYKSTQSLICRHRLVQAFNALHAESGNISIWIHMLRGMSFCGDIFPISSADSTVVAFNFWREESRDIVSMVNKWDAIQCPRVWIKQPEQAGFTHES